MVGFLGVEEGARGAFVGQVELDVRANDEIQMAGCAQRAHDR